MVASSVSAAALRGETARFRKPATQKEADILEAATLIFSEKGYQGARTAEIAEAAGVTERTLFRYFRSKEALFRRVMFPALLAAAMPRALIDAGQLFGADARSFAAWHRNILTVRLDAALDAGPQFRMLVGALMTDEALRRKTVRLWRNNVWKPLLSSMRRFRRRGELRSGLRPETVARAVISLNLGYIVARALLAPEADWDDPAEIEETVQLLLKGAGA
ncbi:MAG TPA: helix-turn-helix domain-containing protein [Burkholderiales bacterium]|nr:helix-turn-helix domain-containing protein [Burkholderiales bacterium]